MTATAAKKAPAKKAAPQRSTAPARGVSEEHKQAMLVGRQEGAAVRRYLEALKIEQAPKRRGRRRTPEQTRERISVIDAELNGGMSDVIAELALRQERLLLISDLQETEPTVKSADYEEDFVKVAKAFSERRGIAYDAWREIGVPVVILRKAGITSR